MNVHAYLAVALLVVTAAVCGAKEPKQRGSVVRDGSTPERAVIITGPLKQYVTKERAWIAKHYPGSSRFPGNQALLIHGDGYVDSITITTADGKQKTIYFDISRVVKK